MPTHPYSEHHSSAAIEVFNLTKHFPSVVALAGLDLTIHQGEFFGLLGPNGAGKSTLINILAGLTRATSGQVSVCGHDVVRDFRQARRSLGVVPQELVFDPFFKVREVLKLQAGYFGLGTNIDSWIDELLSALNLTEKADANMRSLSGGMKRRVLIAQALVHRPKVIVLDEPTAGVDVELRRNLWTLMRKLHNEGTTIVLTTHYLEEAEELCERIAILNRGRIVALETTAGLLAAHAPKARPVILSLAAPLESVPQNLSGIVQQVNALQLRAQLSPREGLFELLKTLHEHGITVVEAASDAVDLEEIFLGLTQKTPAANL